MQLLQCKVRCVQDVAATGWFKAGQQVSIVYDRSGRGGTSLLRTLETINPPYDIQARCPFVGYPEFVRQGSRLRRVHPHKKTAAYMIFGAEPELVRVLDTIDPALIETDRIEVGRRLDSSRWLNFVEISAATRWSEIGDAMHALQAMAADQGWAGWAAEGSRLFATLQPTDRLKQGRADSCRQWLRTAPGQLDSAAWSRIRNCLRAVERAERFALARRITKQWLPYCVYLQPYQQLRTSYPFTEIYSGRQSNDPISFLLGQLCRRYALADQSAMVQREQLDKHSAAVRHLLSTTLPSQSFIPELTVTDGGVELCHRSASDVESLLAVLGTVSLLAMMVTQKMPLLLLDQYERAVPPQQQMRLFEAVQQLGRESQIILATRDKRTVAMKGWSTILDVVRQGSENEVSAIVER